MPLKPFTSASITFEIAHTAALSLAEATDLPVEISSWVFERLELMPFSVWSATMELAFVRMLDILWSFMVRRFAPGCMCRRLTTIAAF